MLKEILLGIAVLANALFSSAQTRTVAATDADHTSIADALAFFDPDPDGLAENVIQITDSGLYDEAISVTVPVTLEGTAANRPVIAAQRGPVQVDSGDGLCVVLSSPGTVTLRRLIVIPSKTLTPSDDLLRAGSTGLRLNLEDIIVTANNGADAPVTLDGLTEADMTGALHIGDDAAYLSGAGTTYDLTNVVLSHAQGGAQSDGLVCSPEADNFYIHDGCVFSYNRRLGIQANGIDRFVISAPTERVLVIGNKGYAGIAFLGAQQVSRTIDGCNIINNMPDGGNFGAGLLNGVRGSIAGSFHNMLIAGNGETGILVADDGSGYTVIFDVTIVDNGAAAIETTGLVSAASDVFVADSILAGSSAAPGTQAIVNGGGASIFIDHSAVVTAGPYALAAMPAGVSVNVTDSINDDPKFVDAMSWNVCSGLYLRAATGDLPLDGGARLAPECFGSLLWLD